MFNLRDYPLYLASASPRRKELLEGLGLNFSVIKAPFDEPAPNPAETARQYAVRMADQKAAASLAAFPDAGGGIILAADTVIGLDSRIIGKPASHDQALAILKSLNGRGHKVITAFCLRFPNPDGQASMNICEYVETEVIFDCWPDEILSAYANSAEVIDKAGAYAIQGGGGFLIREIRGSWTNVVGLPLTELVKVMLRFNLLKIA